jgi:3-oxoacyl-[acyl-carrier protein] reductase
MDVEHRVAVVTGGARRGGKAIALALARSGARVIITFNTSAEEAAITVGEIERSGGQAAAVPCDQRDLGAIDRLFERLRQEVDRLDILINSAAIM